MLRLKVCLNGGRLRTAHPAVASTPAKLARSARAAVRAGAEAVHLHPRAADGTESLRTADLGPAVAAVRAGCPGVPLGVSTGRWITSGDVEQRQAEVSGWAALDRSARPDFASVNLSEPGYAELLRCLSQAGIGAEPESGHRRTPGGWPTPWTATSPGSASWSSSWTCPRRRRSPTRTPC